MNYPYKCKTGHYFEISKPVAEINRKEKCPECGEVCGEEQRKIFAPQVVWKEKPGGLSIINGQRASKM